jgi:hypothetical protein
MENQLLSAATHLRTFETYLEAVSVSAIQKTAMPWWKQFLKTVSDLGPTFSLSLPLATWCNKDEWRLNYRNTIGYRLLSQCRKANCSHTTPWRLLMIRQTHRLFQEKAQTRKYYEIFSSVSSYNCSCYDRNIASYGHVCNVKRETDGRRAHRHPARNSLQLLDTCYPTQFYHTHMRLNLIAKVSSSFTFSTYSPPLHFIPSHDLLHEM